MPARPRPRPQPFPSPPLPPMEADHADALPRAAGWQYEPKWDGFRCLAFRDGASVRLQSKSCQPLERYFPEVAEALGTLGAPRFVLDGELVVPTAGGALSFDALLQRIHPAASRVARLARETPAQYVVFDLLGDERGRDLRALPLDERRRRLEAFVARHGGTALRLSPATRDAGEAARWLAGGDTWTDGVVAKKLDLPYRSGERDGMLKVKRQRTADCVVGGFRDAAKGGAVGSLLLGLYDAAGRLHHVGFTSGLDDRQRKELLPRLRALEEPPGFTGRAPGGPSRWNRGRPTAWHPLRPELVVEVGYDHVSEGRFRHGTRLLRFRPDKAARLCRMEQISR